MDSGGPHGRAVWTSDGEFSDSRGKLVSNPHMHGKNFKRISLSLV